MKLELFAGKMVRETTRSAGFDVFSYESDRVILRPLEFKPVRIGMNARFEAGYAALIWDKSGYAIDHGITILGGLIDGDYPNEWKAILLNMGKEPFVLDPGKKVTQVVFVRLAEIEEPGPNTIIHPGAHFETKNVIRTGGFGSTGT